MNFQYSDEQTALADMLGRYVADRYEDKARIARMADPAGYRADDWRELAELGVIALRISEENGGLGGSMTDLMVAVQALGPGLLVDPWLPALIATRLIGLAGNDDQKTRSLGPVAEGAAVVAYAYAGRWGDDVTYTGVTAMPSGDGFMLRGEGLLALGAGADAILIPARTSGKPGQASGLSLFLVAANSAGLSERRFRLADGSVALNLSLDGVTLGADMLVGAQGDAYAAIEEALAEAAIALCAEAIGIMDAAMAATVEHLKTRKQFGTTLSSFQAIQHRMADCSAALEITRGLVMKAAIIADDPDASRADRLLAAFGAKALTARTARKVAEETVQFHGAIGITEELWTGRAFKRLTLIAGLLGDERTMTRRCDVLREGAN